MTLYEYDARMHAFNAKQEDESENQHMQAWLNHQVTLTKAKGKTGQEYVYKTFNDFYTGKKKPKQKSKKLTDQQKKLAHLAMIANQ